MSWKDDLPPIKTIQFSVWPQRATLDDYARATEDVVRVIRKLSSTASVYGFGNVGTPGFSDLDFAVVLEDEGPSIELEKWEALKRTLSPMTRYTLLHRPFIVNRSLWNEFAASNDFSNIHHLAGPLLPPLPPPDQSTAIIRLIKSVEEGVLFPYRGLVKPILERRVRVRPHLNTLCRLRHKARVLAAFGVQKPDWEQCAEALTELRQTWYSFSEAEQVRAVYDLTIRCIEIESEMIEERARLIEGLGIAIPELSESEKEVVGVFDNTIAFVHPFDGERSHEFIVRSHEMAASIFYILPAAFMAPLLIYSERGGRLRQHLRDRTAVYARIPTLEGREFRAELNDRLRMLDDYLRFIDERKVHWGMLFDHSKEPQQGVESLRSFWERAQPHVTQPEDIIPFGLRRQLAEARAQTVAIMESETWQVAWFIRGLRDTIAPPNSLLGRLYRWFVGARSTLSRRPPQVDEQPATEP